MQTISKLGLQAGDAFNSNDELIRFTELLNKNFVIGGSSATEQAAAMYQLTQAMGSGRLQGDEYRSIIENAPMLAGAIEEYMRNVQGSNGGNEGLVLGGPPDRRRYQGSGFHWIPTVVPQSKNAGRFRTILVLTSRYLVGAQEIQIKDGTGSKTRRRRTSAGRKGISMDCQDPSFYTGSQSDLATATSAISIPSRTLHSSFMTARMRIKMQKDYGETGIRSRCWYRSSRCCQSRSRIDTDLRI